MPDSVVLTLFYVALIAWAARAEYRRAKERRMEKQLEVMFEEDPVVIEAAPEQITLKQDLFRQIETLVEPTTIIGSNIV